MDTPSTDKLFAGSIPEIYDTLLVPLLFEPFATDLALRVEALKPSRVLEVAAGTGVVTRAMAVALPPGAEIVATDLNPPMIERAAAMGTARPVVWEPADALQLPFPDGGFDAVVCQFGAMFFPDKPRGFAEARRVLKRGGSFHFNVWDRIEQNEFADTVTQALADVFPADPPRFMARTPHGYFERETIADDLARAGFDTARMSFNSIALRSRAASADVVATAYCQGTPLRSEIEARGGPGLAAATAACAEALRRRFGSGAIEGGIRAHVIAIPAP
jgi:ubiquinone/menaquinone biosynthesis C-methylase UbiE